VGVKGINLVIEVVFDAVPFIFRLNKVAIDAFDGLKLGNVLFLYHIV
jgi:hypothetical protein